MCGAVVALNLPDAAILLGGLALYVVGGGGRKADEREGMSGRM
jgi:hypothetical protein